MKQELLENLIRVCVREILDQVNEIGSELKSSPAPNTIKTSKIPATQEVPGAPEVRGIVFVNPRDKSKIQPLQLSPTSNDIMLKAELTKFIKPMVGSTPVNVVPAVNMIKSVINNPTITSYVYLTYDPELEEMILKADRSLQVAKDGSVLPTKLVGTSISTGATPAVVPPSPMTANVDEELKKVVKKMVSEFLKNR